MKNIRGHAVSIPPQIVDRLWSTYSLRYKSVEKHLKNKPFDDFFSLYIHNTGAFQLERTRFDTLSESALKKWLSHADNSIRLQTKVILRGINYFPGLIPGTNSEKIKLLKQHYLEALIILGKVDSADSLITYLALLDNIKNFQMLTLYLVNKVLRKNYGSSTKETRQIFNNYLTDIYEIESCFVQSYVNKQKVIPEHPQKIRSTVDQIFQIIHELLPQESVEKDADLIRKVREANNPIKLIEFAALLSESYLTRRTLLIGLEYGGMELPFLINAYRELLNKQRLPFITVNVSSYSTSNANKIQELNDLTVPYYFERDLPRVDSALILDDSVTTGRTLAQIKSTIPESVKKLYFAAVSFTNTNRYHHLTRSKHGGLNPWITENSIFAYQSNYTKTYSRETYLNRAGVFDKEKNRIINLLSRHYTIQP